MPDDKQVCIECDGCGTTADDNICKLCRGMSIVKSTQPMSVDDILIKDVERRLSGGIK